MNPTAPGGGSNSQAPRPYTFLGQTRLTPQVETSGGVVPAALDLSSARAGTRFGLVPESPSSADVRGPRHRRHVTAHAAPAPSSGKRCLLEGRQLRWRYSWSIQPGGPRRVGARSKVDVP